MPFREIGKKNEPGRARGDATVPSPPPRVRPKKEESSATRAREEPPPGDRDYKVGRGKPPVHTRFEKGKSGNPAGRPRGSRGLNAIVRENLLEKVQVRTSQGVKNMPRIEALVHKQLELAMKGDQRAAAKLLSIYAVAVPEEPAGEASDKAVDLSPTDEVILSLYREELLAEIEGDNR